MLLSHLGWAERSFSYLRAQYVCKVVVVDFHEKFISSSLIIYSYRYQLMEGACFLYRK